MYKDIIINLLESKEVKNIKIANDEIRCCCPFHDEDNPSFSINIETGNYICFSGKCNVKGDIYSFISKMTNTSYSDAKRKLDINFANVKFSNIISNTLKLFKDENKDEKVMLNDYDFIELINFKDKDKILKQINIDEDIAIKVGLKICLSKPYKSRLVVPISKDIYEFRDLTKKSNKKCLYESGVKIGNHLFSIIVSNNNSIFLTEGTKDAMSVAGFGFNSCCTFGINISNKQISKILKLGISKVYILRDNDEAGLISSKNTYKLLKQFLDCQIIKYPNDFKYKDPNEIQNKEEFFELLKFNQGRFYEKS